MATKYDVLQNAIKTRKERLDGEILKDRQRLEELDAHSPLYWTKQYAVAYGALREKERFREFLEGLME